MVFSLECIIKYTKNQWKVKVYDSVIAGYFLDSLYKGTAEHASPYIMLRANGCK